MTKGRSTKLEERIEIVKYCIDNNKNYQLTAEIFDVSYQQVYGWVRKFEADGEDALIDKRGRNKVESELTEEDKIRLTMKKMEKENERLRAENAFLKKLQELEGRRY
ncbi:helix-turn-helix domain-containing protein [Tissierella sp. MSJ-40]|uniref:Helix-turn-helix domain-containing protein n=1 Tax=Tissierella simiarum TaxID=2841534 RepID=A0ABS6E3L7_9FIRM|nr:helix-turn-helix domain-containing protein [Tissierella simiarum]MBU5437497.1 helix-turn-helix domain-containing protein [Tissierella simiarum]